jgi:hypothetical protein
VTAAAQPCAGIARCFHCELVTTVRLDPRLTVPTQYCVDKDACAYRFAQRIRRAFGPGTPVQYYWRTVH